MQEPHSLLEQPGLVPVSFRSSLRTFRSVEFAFTFRLASLPLTFRVMFFDFCAGFVTDRRAARPGAVPKSQAATPPTAVAVPPTTSFTKPLLEIFRKSAPLRDGPVRLIMVLRGYGRGVRVGLREGRYA